MFNPSESIFSGSNMHSHLVNKSKLHGGIRIQDASKTRVKLLEIKCILISDFQLRLLDYFSRKERQKIIEIPAHRFKSIVDECLFPR